MGTCTYSNQMKERQVNKNIVYLPGQIKYGMLAGNYKSEKVWKFYKNYEHHFLYPWFVCFMVFNDTFNNISWRSVLLVDETGVSGENHRPVASH